MLRKLGIVILVLFLLPILKGIFFFSDARLTDVKIIEPGVIQARVSGWPVQQLTKEKLFFSTLHLSLEDCASDGCHRIVIDNAAFRSEQFQENSVFRLAPAYIYATVSCPLYATTLKDSLVVREPIDDRRDYRLTLRNYMPPIFPAKVSASVPINDVCSS